MSDQEYEAHLDALISEMTKNPEHFFTPYDLIKHLIPDHPMNGRIFLAGRALLKFTPSRIEAAMNKRRKECDLQAKAEAKKAAAERLLGAGAVNTPREFVAAYADAKTFMLSFGGEFRTDGEWKPMENVLDSMVLDKDELELTFKDTNIKLALNEWFYNQRQARLKELKDLVNAPAADPAATIQQFKDIVCTHYFVEPDFACAAVMNFMHQVKRKMFNLDIVQHYMLVLQGSQDAGKSSMIRMISKVIEELRKQIDLSEVTSPNNLDIYNFFILDADELTQAERADVAGLKSLISSDKRSPRVYYSQNVRDVRVCSTLCGTCNFPLATIIRDPSGMRRFIEVRTKRRFEIEPYWQQIKDFDWLELWRAVDMLGPDPMIEFKDELLRKQEELRETSAVESWAMHYRIGDCNLTTDTSTKEHHDYYSRDLFDTYKFFEQSAFERNRLSLNHWETDFKALIADGKAERWSWEKRGKKTVFSYQAFPKSNQDGSRSIALRDERPIEERTAGFMAKRRDQLDN